MNRGKGSDRGLWSNLQGTTAAKARMMNEEERRVVLLKRKIRNRESAARARQRQKVLAVEAERMMEDLMRLAKAEIAEALELQEKLKAMKEENERLAAMMERKERLSTKVEMAKMQIHSTAFSRSSMMSKTESIIHNEG